MEIDVLKYSDGAEFNVNVAVHSFRITSENLMSLYCVCQPFWEDATDNSELEAVSIEFTGFSDIASDFSGMLMSDDGPTAYSVLSVRKTEDLAWVTNSNCKIYCNEPIPYPSSVLLEIEQALLDVGSPVPALACVGGFPPKTLTGYTSLAKQESFLLCDFPPKAAYDAICRQLTEQKVDHTVLETKSPATPLLYVQLGKVNFFCESAMIKTRTTKLQESALPDLLNDHSRPQALAS